MNSYLNLRQWHPTPVLLPGKSHGWRSLEGCSPWGRWGLDTTEQLHFHFSLSCIGEGNGNPLQYSCLENPRDGGSWWAAIYGVAQSRTRLKRRSSSSSSIFVCLLCFCLVFALRLMDLCISVLTLEAHPVRNHCHTSSLLHSVIPQHSPPILWLSTVFALRMYTLWFNRQAS